MNKQATMFGVLGLIVGLVIGFMGANSLNRSAAGQVAASPSAKTAAGPIGSNSALPPDHPPIGATSGEADDTADAQQPTGGALPQVTAAIEKAKQQPNDYDAQMTAADLYYQIQRFDEAAKYYEAANKLKPSEIEPMIKAGNAYFDGEKYPQAEKWYIQALAKKPDDINVRTDLGLTFFLREPKELDRAIKEYKASLAINPTHEITLQNLALAYEAKSDNENYAQTLEKLRAVNPNNPIFKRGQK